MAITFGFFDSVSGDRTYDADQMSTYFEGLISDGVYENIGDKFLVTSNSGLTLNVGSGRAIVRSHWIKNDATATVTLDPADLQYGRIDAVVLRYDTSARSISLAVKKGTPSDSPSMPAITRNDSVYELYLASVLLKKAGTQPEMITDLRPSTYCGWVTGIVKQVDTSQLFVQWQEAYERQYAKFDAYMQAKMTEFNIWFEHLTRDLTVDCTIEKYQAEATPIEGSVGTIINIPEYDPETDVLFAFVNGVHYAGDIDYRVNVSQFGTKIMELLPAGRTFNDDDRVIFVVLKSVVGGNITQSSLVLTKIRSNSALFGIPPVIVETNQQPIVSEG